MYRYTALGDSITAGYSATAPAFAYPSRVVRLLGATTPAVGEVLAEPGWTSADLETAVLSNSPVPLSAANGISIWVGGDDLIQTALQSLQSGRLSSARTLMPGTLRHYGRDIGTLVGAIRRVSKARLVLCTQYNPFPNSPAATEAIAGLNSVTQAVAQRTGAVLAPVHEWFAGNQANLIRGYRTGRIEDVLHGHPAVHPNNRGHEVIATNLAPLLA